MNAPVILHDISLFYYRLVVANCQLFSFLHISNFSLVYLYAVFILKIHIHSILDTIKTYSPSFTVMLMMADTAPNNTPATGHTSQVKSHLCVQKLQPR